MSYVDFVFECWRNGYKLTKIKECWSGEWPGDEYFQVTIKQVMADYFKEVLCLH